MSETRTRAELDDITARIGFPAENMWRMTEQEIIAYEKIKGLAETMPRDLLDKYGLYDHWRGTSAQKTSPCHWLVVRYLENHKGAAKNWHKSKSYYCILEKAEMEYLNLPPFKERYQTLMVETGIESGQT